MKVKDIKDFINELPENGECEDPGQVIHDLIQMIYQLPDESPNYTLAQIRQAGKEGEVNHLDVEHIIDLLKEGSEALVSVEDRLPDEKDGRTNYLVLSNGEYEIARINEWGWHYGTRDTQNMVFGVTHWQQLPELPNSDMQTNGASQEKPNSKVDDGNQKEPLYRWVRASERLPEKQHNYHVRIAYQLDSLKGVWNTASLWNGEYWEHPTKYETYTGKPEKANVIEWLEEYKVETPEQDELWDYISDKFQSWIDNDFDERAASDVTEQELKPKFTIIKK